MMNSTAEYQLTAAIFTAATNHSIPNSTQSPTSNATSIPFYVTPGYVGSVGHRPPLITSAQNVDRLPAGDVIASISGMKQSD